MDISNLISVSERIADYIKPGMLIVVESSVSIGTTRVMGKTIENTSKIKIGIDVGLSYCPERYNPSLPLGDKIPEIIYNDKPTGIKNLTLNEIARVVGGIDEKSRVLTKAIYLKIIQAEIHDYKKNKWSKVLKWSNYERNFMFEKELAHFLNCIKKRKATINPLEDDGIETLKIGLGIINSSKAKKMIKL